jgi:hypothetical protein
MPATSMEAPKEQQDRSLSSPAKYSFTVDSPSGPRAETTREKVLIDNANRKLKNFSGENKQGDTDFKHWCRAATRIIEETELSEERKRGIILQSLHGQAEDVVELHRKSSAAEIVKILEQFYGATYDPHDLLANFYQETQQIGQKTSEFCTKLYSRVCEIIQDNQVSMGEMNSLLVKQFIRGSSDEDMINKLRLDEDTPPEFPQLLAKIRREEARRTEKRLRMKKTVKTQVMMGESAASNVERNEEVEKLKARIAELEAEKNEVSVLTQKVNELEARGKGSYTKKRFCYRCGLDGHVAYKCRKEPNEELVQRKLKEARQGNSTALPQRANASNSK